MHRHFAPMTPQNPSLPHAPHRPRPGACAGAAGRKSKLLAVITTAVVLLLATANTAHCQKFVRMFLLSGQSNMAGSNYMGTYAAPTGNQIWYRHQDVAAGPTPFTWNWTYIENIQAGTAYGLDRYFAYKMQEKYPDDIIAIVKVFRGGASINEWDVGAANWNALTATADAAVADLDQRLRDGGISGWEWTGFCWFQGESNAAYAASEYAGEVYQASWTDLLLRVRDHTRVPDLPTVVARIYKYNAREQADQEMWLNLRRVRAVEERSLLDQHRVAWINTDDLPILDDEPHYSDKTEMGDRFGVAMLNLLNGTSLPFRPWRNDVTWSVGGVTPIANPSLRAAGHEFTQTPVVLHVHPGNGQVSIDWDYSVNADSYSVSYGTSAGNLNQTVSGITANQVVISGLTNGTTYWLAARSHNASGASALTPAVSGTPVAAANTAPWVWLQDLQKYPEYIDFVYKNEPLLLDATVRDNDLSAATYLWEKVSGPGSVTFSHPSAMDTTAVFSAAGTYVVRFTCSDGTHTVTREQTVVRVDTNTAPVVDFSIFRSLALNAPLVMGFTYKDDIHPRGAPHTITWEKVSGPGTISFSGYKHHPHKKQLSFSATGTYTVGLTVSDGELSTVKQVKVFVHDAGLINLALKKTITASSVESNHPVNVAANAVDGIIVEGSGNRASTSSEANAYMEIDLGAVRSISQVRLFHRTDWIKCSNYYVFISDTPFGSTNPAVLLANPAVWSHYDPGTAGFPTTISTGTGRTGRYVRVQLKNTDYLSLSEIEVLGPDGDPPSVPQALRVNVSGGQFVLNWSESSDNAGIARYRVHVDGALAAYAATPSHTLTGLAAGLSYAVQVFAEDVNGNISAASASVTVETPGDPNSFAAWADGHGLAGADRETDADSDGDGIRQIFEYLAGTDPNTAGQFGLAIAAAADGKLQISYRSNRETAPASLSVTLFGSRDLGLQDAWDAVPASLGIANQGNGSWLHTYTTQDPVLTPVQPAYFIRLGTSFTTP